MVPWRAARPRLNADCQGSSSIVKTWLPGVVGRAGSQVQIVHEIALCLRRGVIERRPHAPQLRRCLRARFLPSQTPTRGAVAEKEEAQA